MPTRPLFRHSPRDALLVAVALAQGAAAAAILRAAPGAAAALCLGAGLWWASNTISHNHLHNPLFRARWLNRLFSLYLSVLLGVPQTLWRRRHLWHHGGERKDARPRPLGAFGVAELGAVAALWAALLLWQPRLFLAVYLPGYALGLLLCQFQGHFEHAGDGGRDLRGVSYYGALYNLLWFNDGYHAEHHRHPGEHWSRLPARRPTLLDAPAPSARPPLLRWLDGAAVRLQAAALGRLERLALRPGWVQRFVLRSHERALAALLPRLPRPPRRILIVGGGLFPRTARALGRLLPDAELTLLDRDPAHLELARRQLAAAPGRLRFLCASFTDPGAAEDADLIVVPLAYVGDRAALYRPGGPPRLVHDWLWRARGQAGAVVSPWLLKRLNLVAP